VNQARELADFYGRPFLEFVLPTLPEVPEAELVPDFRIHAGTKAPTLSWELRELQVWAEAKRINALDLFQTLGLEVPQFPAELFVSPQDDPEMAASNTRELIDFSIQDQFKLTRSKETELPEILRGRFEELGVLLLRLSRGRISELKIRGICLAEFPLPVVIFGNEAPTAQAFTLVHEMAHILLKVSGITGQRERVDLLSVEGWCDRFAAAFLMPAPQVEAIVGPRPPTPKADVDGDYLKIVAGHFRVSPHALLIRLVHLKYVNADFYWEKKRREFEQQERDHKSFGRASFYGSRYHSTLGNLYTGLVLDAWGVGRLTNHNAAQYMDIKNLRHLDDIRSHFGSK
jgi:Zn-dependent peptidase ImmA (M78 family)